MAQFTEQPKFTTTILSTADLFANRFVAPDGGLPDASGTVVGVGVYNTKSGEVVPVHVSGKLIVMAAGVVAVGDKISSDAAGKAITATDYVPVDGQTPAVQPSFVCGVALTATTGTDGLFEMIRV